MYGGFHFTRISQVIAEGKIEIFLNICCHLIVFLTHPLT
ncbi:hypothetical protein Cabys_1629 [Caldithrix abyssi DSM 13497]|uniref:Uncharacterized protein n=1 Tax=Caldithrix abyssi DSM 13497 TaxID=880073 RepID=A0A1J1C8Q1_CALAY|nr:hypothetical protein Cabys_1629 [Caldithrix abyssi DSM 13497]